MPGSASGHPKGCPLCTPPTPPHVGGKGPLPGSAERVSHSANVVCIDGEQEYGSGMFTGEDFLNGLQSGGIPPGSLRLKVGAIYFITINLF